MRLQSRVVCGIAVTVLLLHVESTSAQGPETKPNAVPRPSTVRRRVRSLSLEQRIVDDANKKKGAKIGSGQCTDFVNAVLSDVGAKTSTDVRKTIVQNKRVVKIDSYAWGRQVVALGKNSKPVQPKPGNIIQFESCSFRSGSSSWTLGVPHHTSIVKNANGRVVTLLHQNMEGDVSRSKVREDTIDLSGLQSGSFFIYTAVAVQ